jgi:hypothetical protein
VGDPVENRKYLDTGPPKRGAIQAVAYRDESHTVATLDVGLRWERRVAATTSLFSTVARP